MSKIVRTKTLAKGGITPGEKARMDLIAQKWIGIAMQTDPIDPDKITPAIHALYATAGLKKPRVVIVPSPLVMAAAYGASAAIWHQRSATTSATRSATDSATYSATDSATRSATRSATYSATHSATDSATDSATTSATDSATYSATRSATASATASATYSATTSATRSATDSATYSATYSAAMRACYDLAGDFGLACARRWSIVYQGGNMWAGFPAFVESCRDVLGLDLPEFEKWAAWEACAEHGGFRVMHPEFCIVSDFPEFIRTDDQNRAHCETGPSHRWRDGWSLYHWHGVAVPGHWIDNPDSVSPSEVLGTTDADVRAAGLQILGWPRIISDLSAEIIDRHPEGMAGGELLAVQKSLIDSEANGVMKLLRAECPRNGIICFRVPDDIDTAHAAQAWARGIPPEIFQLPAIRT